MLPREFSALAAIPHSRRKCEDATNLVLHRIATAFDDGGRGVPLNKERMAWLFGGDHQWSDCKKALIAGGHIAEADDGAYVVGRQSKRYNLGVRWTGTRYKIVVCENLSLLEKLGRWEDERPERERWLPIHFWLRECLGMITVDIEAIDPEIRERARAVWALDQIVNHPERCSVCAYRRVHSILTNAPKAVRRAVKIGGHEVVELDIGCSQALIAGLFCRLDLTGQFFVKDQIKLGKRLYESGINSSETFRNFQNDDEGQE